ncbi:hypothetical protein EVAR_18222_1 [Eumeta japonica]|uniref:Uncharacterized protein n=1 Tax=Eumeta variegata TaxID=151549 RepID=A0A4C1UJJ1_EUMVA|nr:hypothetical protein EVAR_18222_1 [Eumeta japonica]
MVKIVSDVSRQMILLLRGGDDGSAIEGVAFESAGTRFDFDYERTDRGFFNLGPVKSNVSCLGEHIALTDSLTTAVKPHWARVEGLKAKVGQLYYSKSESVSESELGLGTESGDLETVKYAPSSVQSRRRAACDASHQRMHLHFLGAAPEWGARRAGEEPPPPATVSVRFKNGFGFTILSDVSRNEFWIPF